MPHPHTHPPAPTIDALPPDVLAMLTTLSLIVRNHVSHAWLSKSDERQTVSDGYKHVSAALESRPELDFRVMPDTLSINGQTVAPSGPELRDLIDQLGRVGVHAFVILRGISAQHFGGLMEVLAAQPHELETLGGLAQVLEKLNIEHVRVKRISFREVDEDAVASASPEGNVPPRLDDVLGRAMQALRNSTAADAATVSAILHAVMQEPDILAEAILRVADERAGDTAAPEAKAGSVVEAMRDTCDRLMQAPAAQTQKGKQQIRRALKELEHKMLARIDGAPADKAAALRAAIKASVEELQENLQVDEIAADLLRKRKAAQSSEERLRKFIKRRGLERLSSGVLRTRLAEAGLGAADWDRLLRDSNLSRAPHGTNTDALAKLAELDERLRKAVTGNGTAAPISTRELSGALAELDSAIGSVIGNTAAKLDGLRAEQDQPESPKHRRKKPRRSLSGQKLRLLGELVQEICQPLSVIRSCLFMITAARLGELNAQQAAMLKVVTDGTDRITQLVESLRDISFEPEALSPDEAIVQSLYQPKVSE